MSRSMVWTGLIATLVIVGALGGVALAEPSRQAAAQQELISQSVAAATDLYAQNCAVCHGAAGEGIGAMPALDNDGVRGLDYRDLFNVIARGRYNTSMPAWSTAEGGVLTDAQIDQMIVLLQNAAWDQVAARVAELGLTPPTAVVVEVPDDLLVQISALPGGEALSGALTLYAEKCVACHGANLEGTALAPALNSPDLLAANTDADLARIIGEGVPGTLMAGWNGTLAPDDISALVSLMRRWDEVQMAGIELPAVAVAATPATPEMIAAGGQLYSVACATCHGADALGTRMAPALNSQTFLSETPDAAIYQIIANGVPGTRMPAWGGRLTDADLQALVAYLRSLESTAPVVAQPAPTQQGTGRGGPPWLRNP